MPANSAWASAVPSRPYTTPFTVVAHDRQQAAGPRAGDAFGALANVDQHLPAVTVEEEGDEHTQTELEKANAEYRAAGKSEVRSRTD